MPLSGLAEAVIQPIAEFVLQVAGYVTARILVPILTLGKLRIEPGPAGQWTTPRWHGINRQPDGTYLASADTGAVLGLAIWVVVGVGYVTYKHLS